MYSRKCGNTDAPALRPFSWLTSIQWCPLMKQFVICDGQFTCRLQEAVMQESQPTIIHWAKSHYPPGNHMLATTENVLVPGHNHLLTTGANGRHFYYCLSTSKGDNQSVGSSVSVVSRWLWPGTKTFLVVASMVVTWWIVDFAQWYHTAQLWKLFAILGMAASIQCWSFTSCSLSIMGS